METRARRRYRITVAEAVSSSALRASLAGRFAVGELAGKGGMGEVYAGRAADGAHVAIKRVAAGSVADVSRFVAEAEALERLVHPHVVNYVEHGVTAGGDHYLITEWIDGASLSERLRAGPLSVDETIALAHGVAEALVAAHGAGLIHRDLKPSNLMLPGGRAADVKVIDFGIARAMGEGGGVTATGEIVGTPGFLAPEQARGQRVLDGRADLFGLGAILYEALTGRPAFAADDLMTTLALVLMHAPTPIGELVDGVPPRLIALIDRLLAKDPADRPASAAEVIAELDAIASGAPLPASRATEAPTVRAAPRSPSGRRWIPLAVIGGLAVAAGATIALVAALSDDPAGPPPILGPCSRYELTGCRARCDANDGEACEFLGNATANGLNGILLDRPAGIDLLRRACDLGDLRGCVEGMSQLRRAARAGEVGTGWQDEFIRRLDDACTRSYAPACRMLGTYMRDNAAHGGPDAIARSNEYLDRACALGDRPSCVAKDQPPSDADADPDVTPP